MGESLQRGRWIRRHLSTLPRSNPSSAFFSSYGWMSKRNSHIHVINVAQELEIARALGVMATPSTLVVKDGRIQSYHVGGVPSDVIAQFV